MIIYKDVYISKCGFLCGHSFQTSWEMHSSTMLAHVVRPCLKETDKLSSKVAVPFCVPTRNVGEFLLLLSSLGIDMVSVFCLFNFSIPKRRKVYDSITLLFWCRESYLRPFYQLYFLWWSVCSDRLPIFFCHCCVLFF